MQAYGFMRQDKFDKATPLLNRAYNETPAAQRGRSLVLNRALLDLVQKGNLPRAMKDLYQYFARNPAPDEEASNLLGSILEIAAQNPRWRDGPLYADAFREFARREAVLERHRPGFKRWGATWITQAEFDEIQRKDRELQTQLYDQYQLITRASTNLQSLTQQYNTADAKVRGFANHVHYRDPNSRVVQLGGTCPICQAMYEASQSLNEISADLKAANNELVRANAAYEQLQRRATKPTWPTRYEPIDPNAPPPRPPEHPALAALAATEPVTDPQPVEPGGGGGAPVAPAPAPAAAAGQQNLPPSPPATRPSDLVRTTKVGP